MATTNDAGVPWRAYAACGTARSHGVTGGCGAAAGQPCYDGRSRDHDASRTDYPRLTKRAPCKTRRMPCGPDWPPRAGDVWGDLTARADNGGPVIWHARNDGAGAIEFYEPGGPGHVPAHAMTAWACPMLLMRRAGETVPPPLPSLTAWGVLEYAVRQHDGVVTDPRGRGPHLRPELRRAGWTDDHDRMTPLGYAVYRGWQHNGAGLLTLAEVT